MANRIQAGVDRIRAGVDRKERVDMHRKPGGAARHRSLGPAVVARRQLWAERRRVNRRRAWVEHRQADRKLVAHRRGIEDERRQREQAGHELV